MKAKKIIAIGLVAAMTLGMSTSVFASENPYATVDPKDAPQFSGWDNDYLPTDNVFHAKGQGWLESGVGINETVTNVIVPTMPNLNLKYGDPGPYDFGFDPQRLVDRTGAKKYVDKMNFTQQAKESGVYFLNGPRSSTEAGWNAELNTFDNKSIKLVGTNIGTEPVAFTVTATTKEGKNFTYLENKPVAVTTAKDAFDNLYNQVGETWVNYVTTPRDIQTLEPDEEGNPLWQETSKLVFARDLITMNLDYEMTVAVGGPDAYSATINPFINLQFVKSGETESKYSRAVLEDATANTSDETTFLNNLAAYQLAGSGTTVDPSAVGMYLGLNTALGNETSLDGDYEEKANATATLPANVKEENKDTIDAEATATEVVEGTPDNYDWDYTSGEYGKFIKEERAPFQTVAFWFDGVATKNNEVVMYDEVTHPEGVKIPKFEFTWAFSKEIPEKPEPVVEPAKLISINDSEVPVGFDNILSSSSAFYQQEAGVKLGFDKKIKEIKWSLSSAEGATWSTYSNPDVFYVVDNSVLTVKPHLFEVCNNSGTYRYWKVFFEDELENENSIMFTFTPGSN